ncbi:MAG: dienelactone hydrolase family protein [Candidatus Binatia bacterium]|nr:dienelactone hydrolase family protein [Candidatus Binatia bacterium]
MLADYECFRFRFDNIEHDVYRAGEGPAVIVVHEIPGITPEVLRFAGYVRQAGFRVYLPHLFGVPGKPVSSGYIASSFFRACISREFKVLARNEASPVTNWLRALAREAFRECGGSGVGALGMCLTGNFALAMMIDPAVQAPVLSQPSLPLPISPSHRQALHLASRQLQIVRERVRSGCPVLGLRFTHDFACPPERFQRLREELGNGFEAIEIDSSPGNPHGISPRAHSVLTVDFVDQEGHPTKQALERVLAFFRARLHTGTQA